LQSIKYVLFLILTGVATGCELLQRKPPGPCNFYFLLWHKTNTRDIRLLKWRTLRDLIVLITLFGVRACSGRLAQFDFHYHRTCIVAQTVRIWYKCNEVRV